MSDRSDYDGLRLRAAAYDDRKLLFDWRNDPLVRRNSFTTDPVAWEDHVKWFDRLMAAENARQYLLTLEDRPETPVGQIRIRICDDDMTQAEIGYSVDAAYRGQGYGRALLELILARAPRDLPQLRTLIGRVKRDNAASAAAFAAAGYELLTDAAADSLVYRHRC